MSTIPRDYKLKPYSTKLRKNATKQENHLWYDYLKAYSVHFYRQRIIDKYIVDFYCPKAKLIIELDGSQHYENNAQTYDSQRTDYFSSLGLFVLRFTNLDINNNFYGVCEMIDVTVNSRLCE